MQYKPPFFLFNAHLETIYPAVIRRVDFDFQKSEIIKTPDEDFLEISLSSQNSKRLVIISHGLEGSNQRPYIRGMARACYQAGFDVLAWNFRGCGITMNHQLRFYHSGATEDLAAIVAYAQHLEQYDDISLVGFSLGGNLTLKYAGEGLPLIIKKVVGISVPLDLKSSSEKISIPGNRIYANRFLKSLKNKIRAKASLMPGLSLNNLEGIKTLKDFDDQYTAPLHGYRDADHYYNQCSAIRFLDSIKVPTLIINAKNDPFLSEKCFPINQLKDHSFVKFESPERGGHVGFTELNSKGVYWSEERTVSFLKNAKY